MRGGMSEIARAVRVAAWGWVADGAEWMASRFWGLKRWALLRLWDAEAGR
jgi:hypothetical protein